MVTNWLPARWAEDGYEHRVALGRGDRQILQYRQNLVGYECVDADIVFQTLALRFDDRRLLFGAVAL
jgi:hypothetical protein